MEGSSPGDRGRGRKPPAGNRSPGNGGERPEYTVYRSRPRLLPRLRRSEPRPLRERPPREPRQPGEPREPRGPGRERPPVPGEPTRRPRWGRVLKWAGIAALAWLALSVLAFAVSSQIQSAKLAESAKAPLDGNPLLALVPQNILVLGTDIRSGQFAGPAEAAPKKCLEAAGGGRRPPSSCQPYRSDTMLLVRAGGGTFRQLSIPRDTLADIPGHGPDKINAAYAIGGARLTARTVERFLGIDLDQVAIIDFDGFRKLIDAIGGIEVDLPTAVCSSVSGGAFNLNLKRGEHTLNGYQAITLARTRKNSCGSGENTGTDLERAGFQQLILDGIKSRITDPLRLPYNFIKGPIIGWQAPKAMVSSMGALTMPQLVFAAAIGSGNAETLTPTSLSDPLFIPQEECERKVEEFLGGEPPRTPACSPG